MTQTSQSEKDTGLEFVDLLYAIPVVDLATRLSNTHLANVTPSGFADVAVTLTAVTFGWLGHHTNRQRRPRAMSQALADRNPFEGQRFCQFATEVAIIGAYFALGAHSDLPDGAGVNGPSELWKAKWLLVIFVLYFTWDMLDVGIAKRVRDRQGASCAVTGNTGEGDGRAAENMCSWTKKARAGRRVTFVWILVFAVFEVVALTDAHHGLHSVVVFDGAAIFLLYAYRRVQAWYRGRAIPSSVRPCG